MRRVEGGGTLDVLLACHALRRGYAATIYTYNLQLFDPTWFRPRKPIWRDLRFSKWSTSPRPNYGWPPRAYLEFFERGGQLRFEDLTGSLIRKYLSRSIPVLTGLSATYLHRAAANTDRLASLTACAASRRGILSSSAATTRRRREVLVADPLPPIPCRRQPLCGQHGSCDLRILLGIVTYDANLLIIEPRNSANKEVMPVLIVVNNVNEWPFHIPGVAVVDAKTYLTKPEYGEVRGAKVFNLCRSYRYQSLGYYVTLLATARGISRCPTS